MKRKNMTKFDKAVSAAFTGHRFYNFSQQEVIRERLTKAILEAYEHGISNFISGFAIGIASFQNTITPDVFLTETSSWLRMRPFSLPSMMGERRVEPTTLSRKPIVWAFPW